MVAMLLGERSSAQTGIEVGVASRHGRTSCASYHPRANILALVLIGTFTITIYHQTAKIREEMENRLDYSLS